MPKMFLVQTAQGFYALKTAEDAIKLLDITHRAEPVISDGQGRFILYTVPSPLVLSVEIAEVSFRSRPITPLEET